MKQFNINHDIYIQITELGWKHLKNTVTEEYIKHCIKPYEKIINDVVWYKLQCHEVFSLLPMVFGGQLLFKMNVLIDDESLSESEFINSFIINEKREKVLNKIFQ